MGNTQGGIRVTTQGSLIGGTGPGEGNLISGNGTLGISGSGKGIEVLGSRNRIQGNLIGTDANGTGALGNTGAGVWVEASQNRVNGGNVVAHNATGVVVAFGIRSAIRRNSTFGNASLGIDLKNDGITANDAGDLDGTAPGDPNELQNFPVISLAAVANSQDFLWGSLNSTASSSFLLDFFSNDTCDGSGNGEGKNFIGSTLVSTNASGNATFNVSFPAVATTDSFFTATATDTVGNTSEFSACVQKKVVSDLGSPSVTPPIPQALPRTSPTTSRPRTRGPTPPGA